MARITVTADHNGHVLMEHADIQDIDLEELEPAIVLLEELANAVQMANLEADYSSS